MIASLPARPAHETKRVAEAGFTLVELMVVVAIIALLAAVIIPNYVHARAQAAVSQSEANIKQIATALELYYADNQAYPTTGGAKIGPQLFGAANNPYLTATPTNALKRTQYTYAEVAPAGGKPESYLITDVGPYDPTTLSSLTKGAGGSGLCMQSCTTIQYDPQDGFYGN